MERSTAAVSAVRYSVVLLAAACAACSSFSTVRSAVVHPGPSLMIHGSIASPPGDETAWFYAFNCASDCNEVFSGGDIGLSFSHVPEKGTPFTFGLGSNGLYPYAEGYWQIARSERVPSALARDLACPCGAGRSTRCMRVSIAPATKARRSCGIPESSITRAIRRMAKIAGHSSVWCSHSGGSSPETARRCSRRSRSYSVRLA